MFDGLGGSPHVLERENGKLRLCPNSSSSPPLFVSGERGRAYESTIFTETESSSLVVMACWQS